MSPTQVAVDHATGDAYVLDTGNQTLYKFSGTIVGGAVAELWELDLTSLPGGNPGVRGRGLAINPVNGHVVVSVFGVTVGSSGYQGTFELDSSGSVLSSRADGWDFFRRMAIGNAGEFYVIQSPPGGGNFGVDEYDASGAFVRRLDDSGNPRDVAFDAVNNQLVVNEGTYVAIYDPSGQQIDNFGSGNLLDGTGVRSMVRRVSCMRLTVTVSTSTTPSTSSLRSPCPTWR